MTISSENVEVSVSIDVARVAIAGRGTGRDHSEGVGRVLGGGAGVGSTELESSLSASSHCLVVCVEALVSVLDEEGLLHRDTGGGGEAILLHVTFDRRLFVLDSLLLRRASVLELHERPTQFQSSGASSRTARLMSLGHVRSEHSSHSLERRSLSGLLSDEGFLLCLQGLPFFFFGERILNSFHPFFC